MKVSAYDDVSVTDDTGYSKDFELKDVNVIRKQGQVVLVEWAEDGKPKRALVPGDKINNGLCASYILDAGIPYGLQWEELLENVNENTKFVEALATNLRKEGIWTAEDVTPQKILVALQATYGVDVHKILRTIKEYTRHE